MPTILQNMLMYGRFFCIIRCIFNDNSSLMDGRAFRLKDDSGWTHGRTGQVRFKLIGGWKSIRVYHVSRGASSFIFPPRVRLSGIPDRSAAPGRKAFSISMFQFMVR